VVKELQRHPVRRSVTHVDFLVVDLDVELEVEVPIELVGEAKAVLAELGLVDPALNSLTIRCTPRHIPNAIVIDISAMRLGDVIRVSDLTIPAGAMCPLDPDTAVVTAVGTRAVVEEKPVVEEPTEGQPTTEDTGD
jgi:large subunit ribosomal protein L25